MRLAFSILSRFLPSFGSKSEAARLVAQWKPHFEVLEERLALDHALVADLESLLPREQGLAAEVRTLDPGGTPDVGVHASDRLAPAPALATGWDDHGNYAGAATSIAAGTRSGVIESARDQDWFRLQTTAGARYVFETILGSLADSTLTLYAHNGAQLGFDDDGGPGLASRIEWTAATSGSHFLKVQAYGSYQTGSYSLRVSETVSLGTPSPIGPTGAVTTLTPTFQWSAVAAAARYDLLVNNQTSGQSQIIRQANLAGTSFTTTAALAAGHSYQWWVRAISNSGTAGNWSNAMTFTVARAVTQPATVGVPTPVGPTGTVTTHTPTFQWSVVAGAARYDLWVNNQSTGQGQVIRQTNLAGTSFTVTTSLTPGHTYQWWVRAISSSGTASNWSNAVTFTVAAATTGNGRTLYVNFDGATITRQDLVRYSRDWQIGVDVGIDRDQNGVVVQPLWSAWSSRESYISQVLAAIQQRVSPFGIQVQRHRGPAVEGARATTVFAGQDNIQGSFAGIAGDIDFGNNNATDIVFARPTWSGARTFAGNVVAMANLILHEAGHSWGLFHVDAGTQPEIMGMGYSRLQPADFLNRSDSGYFNSYFAEFSNHGNGRGWQNSFQSLRGAFAGSAGSTNVIATSAWFMHGGLAHYHTTDGRTIFLGEHDHADHADEANAGMQDHPPRPASTIHFTAIEQLGANRTALRRPDPSPVATLPVPDSSSPSRRPAFRRTIHDPRSTIHNIDEVFERISPRRIVSHEEVPVTLPQEGGEELIDEILSDLEQPEDLDSLLLADFPEA